MRYHLTLPARINILGNPSDANEGDFATISAAVELFAHASFSEADKLVLESAGQRTEWVQPEFPLAYTGELDLLKGALNRLYQFSEEFRCKFTQSGIHIACWSEVPRQSGLGGSSLHILLTLAGLRQYYQLDRRIHNDYILAELAQRVESLELGITCGFADRYVPLFGGLAYLDYRGKLHQRPLGEEPFVTYEHLEDLAPHLPLVAVATGVPHNSGDVHGRMRPRYLEEHAAWIDRGGDPPPLVEWMQAAWGTAWQGKIALLNGDLATFGKLMNTNHHLVDRMMRYCGFKDGAGWADNLFIRAALENGALGAKLTGAGGGGSVFALVLPGKEEALVQAWQRTAEMNGLDQAIIFQPNIYTHGLQVREVE
jgi:galactokinase/mevalonate kinase-like predicted kinase